MILALSFISILVTFIAFEGDSIPFSYFIVQAILSIAIFAKESKKYEKMQNKRRRIHNHQYKNTSSTKQLDKHYLYK